MADADAGPLTSAQLDAFWRRGFLVVEDVFDVDEVEHMRQAFERLEQRASTLEETAMVDGSQFVVEPQEHAVRIHRVVWCGGAEPVLSRMGRDARLVAVAAQLLGSNQMEQLINQAHFKLPGDQVAFAWHQDSVHRRYGTELWTDVNGRGSFIETATAIDPMTPDNGPLEFIPGSHKNGHIDPDPDTGELPAGSYDPTRAVTVEMSPGSVALFGPYVIHGSRPNRGRSPRRLFLNGFAYPGANRRVYPGVDAGRLVGVREAPPSHAATPED